MPADLNDPKSTLLRLRVTTLIGGALVILFMYADLLLVPDTLQGLYVQNRLYLQIPTIILFLAFSYTPLFLRYHQQAIFLLFVLITYLNYLFIAQCWILESFAFPYEGTLLYAFFAFFVTRMRLFTAIAFVIVAYSGFIALLYHYPIYGERTQVSLAFVGAAQIVGLIGIYEIERFVKKTRAANEQLLKLSRTDQLTGLLNRGTYEKEFHHLIAISQRPPISISTFMIDIDYFKDFNDGYGHQRGDEVIQTQARILKEVFQRDSDIIARYGGEEFVAVASNLTIEETRLQAQKIIDKWHIHGIKHGKGKGNTFVSCSIGINHCVPNKSTTVQYLTNEADLALYEAKAKGRNTFVEHVS